MLNIYFEHHKKQIFTRKKEKYPNIQNLRKNVEDFTVPVNFIPPGWHHSA